MNSQGIEVDPRMGCLFFPGSSEKCIQNEEGTWFTPQEFAIKGKGKKARHWRWSVRCKGKTLSQLLEVL